MTAILLKLIDFYQATLSPDHSNSGKLRYPHGYCRFYPSCSEYSRLAILKQGALKGVLKTLWRILRCNPWSKGGLDPV